MSHITHPPGSCDSHSASSWIWSTVSEWLCPTASTPWTNFAKNPFQPSRVYLVTYWPLPFPKEKVGIWNCLSPCFVHPPVCSSVLPKLFMAPVQTFILRIFGHVTHNFNMVVKFLPLRGITFANAFSWMKMYRFWLKFHWNLFPWVQFTIFEHWVR